MQSGAESFVTAAVLAAIFAFALPGAVAAGCDLSQEVAVGKFYDISNPNYPNKYKGHTKCRWRATSAPGTHLELSCGLFDIPESKKCRKDKVLISPSGDDSMNDAHTYCGKGTFTLVSDENKLTMVLESRIFSRGGRFLCNITASYPSCMCGIKKETRIVGGEYTGVNEYPFMAGLVDVLIRELYCGATIISQHFGVTAAHCMVGRNVTQIGLLVGEHNITTGKDTNATRLLKLLWYEVHPGYDRDQDITNGNDIALVRVDGVIPMSPEVMPACLPFRFRNYDFTNEIVEVLGWGTTEYGGATSDTLQKADLEVLSPARCSAVINKTDSSQQLCSYNEGKDACQVDSGGPLLWQDKKSQRVYVVAIVSSGIACATSVPGVNMRVTYYLDWITNVIRKEDSYCNV